jgi:hypothetical protein
MNEPPIDNSEDPADEPDADWTKTILICVGVATVFLAVWFKK